MKISNVLSIADLGTPYDRLADFLDFDEVIKIEQTYGGRQIKFRRNCSDPKAEYPELTIILGSEKALRVIKTFYGEWVYFPSLRKSAMEKIKCLIISECNGYNYQQLARKFGYTDRHIRNLVNASKIKSSKVDDNQLSLFDVP